MLQNKNMKLLTLGIDEKEIKNYLISLLHIKLKDFLEKKIFKYFTFNA